MCSVHYKMFGFVHNKKQKGIAVPTIIMDNVIPNTIVLIYMDKNVAYIGSINNVLKVWTIHSPKSEWTQCNCHATKEGMICKHTIKVFKMLNTDINNGVIVRATRTKHKQGRAIPMLLINLSLHSTESYFAIDIAKVANIENVLENVILHVGLVAEYKSNGQSPRIMNNEPI